MNKRVRVKICGITRLEDALNAVECGVDALGFVFYPKSPRYISPAKAQEIIQQLPPFVTSVGLFMDATNVFVKDVMKHVALDMLQFHGKETPEYCSSFHHPYIKAVPMNEKMDIQAYCESFSESRGFLLDSTRFGVAGGTGEKFDWADIPVINKPVVMAGGINHANVSEAIGLSGCYGVDLSSGVESSPGVKDKYKMRLFFESM